MTYLIAYKVYKPQALAYRYYVELTSTEADPEGISSFWKTIDFVGAQPTKEAIVELINKCGWLRALITVVLASCEAHQFFTSDLDMGGEEE